MRIKGHERLTLVSTPKVRGRTICGTAEGAEGASWERRRMKARRVRRWRAGVGGGGLYVDVRCERADGISELAQATGGET